MGEIPAQRGVFLFEKKREKKNGILELASEEIGGEIAEM